MISFDRNPVILLLMTGVVRRTGAMTTAVQTTAMPILRVFDGR